MGQETWSNKKWLDEQLELGKILPNGKVYKEITGLLEANASVQNVIILENDTEYTVTATRIGVGQYELLFNAGTGDGLTKSKIWWSFPPKSGEEANDDNIKGRLFQNASVTGISLNAWNSAGSLSDFIISFETGDTLPFTFRIYP